jgi:4-hydroxybenzoate polyprenyltransferase
MSLSRAERTILAQSLAGHLQMARPDHWVKNIFVLPGIYVALMFDPSRATLGLVPISLLGLISTCLISSSNYVLNEILDAPFDRLHPSKRQRPVPSGRVNIPLAYAQWIALMIVGVGIALQVSTPFTAVMLAWWVMGIIYNVPPLRSKDVPYLDVLSEALNNPLRMLAGWFIADPPGLVPGSLLFSYWMAGAYFMAIKRWAELRHFGDGAQAANYRKSFAFYTEQRLLVSITFYASAAMLFLGAFIMRYRLELILAVPLIALVMAVYLSLAFKDDSAAQAPEKLLREPALVASVVTCVLLITMLLFLDIPILFKVLAPTAPTQFPH